MTNAEISHKLNVLAKCVDALAELQAIFVVTSSDLSDEQKAQAAEGLQDLRDAICKVQTIQ